MNKFNILILGLVSLFGFAIPVLAASVFATFQGGTGTSTPSGILYGDNGATTVLHTVTIGSGLSFLAGTLSATGGGSSGLSTTSPWTIGRLAFVVDDSHVSSVATGTASFSSPLSGGPLTVVGAGGTISCPTCSTATGANPSQTVGLSAVNGSANTFLRSDGAPALSQAIAPTWTALHFFAAGATSTSLTVYNYFAAPTSTNPVLSVSGQIAVNVNAASTSLQVRNGGQFGLYASTSKSFMWATTTPSVGNTATDTLIIVTGNRGQVFNNIACKSVGGTATVEFGTGTASSTVLTTTGTPTRTTLTTNNSFDAFGVIMIGVGNYSASTVTRVSCGLTASNSY